MKILHLQKKQHSEILKILKNSYALVIPATSIRAGVPVPGEDSLAAVKDEECECEGREREWAWEGRWAWGWERGRRERPATLARKFSST